MTPPKYWKQWKLTGVFGLEQLYRNSSLCNWVCSVGSLALRWILGNVRSIVSNIFRIRRNNGRSSRFNFMQSSAKRFRACGQSDRTLVISGRRTPRPTFSRISSLLLMWLYGSWSVSSSYITIPNAYTSLWNEYGLDSLIRITSGAILMKRHKKYTISMSNVNTKRFGLRLLYLCNEFLTKSNCPLDTQTVVRLTNAPWLWLDQNHRF